MPSNRPRSRLTNFSGDDCSGVEPALKSFPATSRFAPNREAETVNRIHIIGRKNSGKTTLIVDLVQHLSSLGYRIGTIKHTHHQHELDTPGKDSYRHRLAGAAAVGIVSPSMSAVFWPPAPNESEPTRYDLLLASFPKCDIVLVEGDSQTDALKIEVWRKATSELPMALNDHSIAGVVTDDDVRVAAPVWSRSNVAALAEKLLEVAGA